jgi:hypothetical protein
MLGGVRLFVANIKARKVFKKYHGYRSSYDGWLYGEYPDYQPLLDKFPPIGSYRKTKVFCSNPLCCGNPRRIRYKKHLTLQELKANEDFKTYDLS